jgi:hypothetical protein
MYPWSGWKTSSSLRGVYKYLFSILGFEDPQVARPYLQSTIVPFSERTSELNHCLHALNLALNNGVKVLLLDLWELQKVYRSVVGDIWRLGDKRPQALIDVLGDKGSIRSLV